MGRKKKRRKTDRLASGPRKRGPGLPSRRVPAWRVEWPWICLGLILLFVVVVRIRVLPVPLERDEGEFAYAGQLILEGIPPYQLAYNVKLPGIYAAYALIMAVFGQTPSGIHLGLLFVNLGRDRAAFFSRPAVVRSLCGGDRQRNLRAYVNEHDSDGPSLPMQRIS